MAAALLAISSRDRVVGRILWRPSRAAVLVSGVLRGTVLSVPSSAIPAGRRQVDDDHRARGIAAADEARALR
jgi:hypothetical protein